MSLFSLAKSNPLFTVDDVGINVSSESTIDKIQAFKRTILKPVDSTINVHGDFDWKNKSDADEVPLLKLTEMTLVMGGLARSLANIYNFGKNTLTETEKNGLAGFINSTSEPYASMYQVENTGFIYQLPWLLNNGSNIRKITNSWADEDGNSVASEGGSPTSTGSAIIGGLAGLAAGYVTPGVGMEKIQSFSQTSHMSLTISFPLYNTFSVESAYKNYSFVNLLTYQNLKNRTSLVSYVPPCVYEVESKGGGGVYMPVACMENLSIESIGTTRSISKEFSRFIGTDEPILIPEAYSVNITLRELIPQSANIFARTMGGAKVQVTTTNQSLNSSGKAP